MHQVQIYDDLYQIPENWDELTPEEMIYLVALTHTDTPLEKVKIHMMLYCLKAHVTPHRKVYEDQVRIAVGKESKNVKFSIRKKSYLLTTEEVHALANLFTFLFDSTKDKYGRAEKYYISPNRSINPYPNFRIRLRKFTGPDDGLYDITFEQFIYMQTYLDAMKSDQQQINRVLACLWHRGKEFDINRLEDDAALLSRLPALQKIVMYWYISGSIAGLGYSFPRLFSGSGEIKNNVFDSQMRLLNTLASSDMTKKDAVRKGNLMDALYTMDESIRQQEEMDEKFNNQ